MVGRTRLLIVAMVLVLGLAIPGQAQEPGEPEISDPCGLGAHTVEEQPLPWLDICEASFDVVQVDDVPELTVSLRVAGHLSERTDGIWRVGWRSGECGFEVGRDDRRGTGVDELGSPAVELIVACGVGQPGPCEPPVLEDLGFGCGALPPEQRFDIDDGHAVAGDELTWTVRFDGALAEHADAHRPGAVLTGIDALTGAKLGPASLFLAYCQGQGDEPWRCRSHVGDWVPQGRDHHVPARSHATG